MAQSSLPFVPLFNRFPVTFVRGQGTELFDDQGRHYWDFLAGIGVNSLGYGHPRIRKVLEESGDLLHVSNLYFNQPAIDLSRKMAEITGGYLSFWANSGTEANEAAIKLARRYGRAHGERTNVLSFEGAFHGRTFGSLSATPTASYQEPFAPLVPGFYTVPFGNLPALEQALDRYRPCAVLFEAIQGEGGIRVPPPGFLSEAVKMVQESGALAVMDEIQTGMGRTGQWFGFQIEPVEPDIISVAKGLGAGVPIGGLLAKPSVATSFAPGDHGTTFGGNLLAARMALEVVDWLDAGGMEHVNRVSRDLERVLNGFKGQFPLLIEEVRGRGLMWGMVLTVPSAPVVKRALEAGVVINAPQPNVVRLLPPLIVEPAAIEAFEQIMLKIFMEL